MLQCDVGILSQQFDSAIISTAGVATHRKARKHPSPIAYPEMMTAARNQT